MKSISRALMSGVTAAGVCFSLLSGVALAAEENKPTANLTMGAYSQYIWRGFELSKDSVVIQPSMTVAYKGFSANVWGNLDTDPYSFDGEESSNWNETDMTLAYGWEMGPVAMTAGYIYYSLDGVDDTQEVYVGATLNTLLKPTLTVYRDFDFYPGWYTTLGVSHSIPVTDNITLDLAGVVSYLAADEATSYSDADGGSYSNFHDGVLSLGLTIPVAQYFTITPKLSYTFALSGDAQDIMKGFSKNGDDDNFIYGGVAVSMAF